jgi:hypothetical protein
MSVPSAEELWQEKLHSLQAAEALTVDPAEKFKLKQDIAEARRKLQELGADAATTLATGHPPPVPADISRIIKYAPERLIGREDETRLLNDAWAKAQNNETKRPHVLTFVALGSEGKTSLVAKWAADLAHQNWPGCDAVFAWSFYSQGTREEAQSFVRRVFEGGAHLLRRHGDGGQRAGRVRQRPAAGPARWRAAGAAHPRWSGAASICARPTDGFYPGLTGLHGRYGP